MAHYRLYGLDGAGTITRAQFVEGATDEDAIMIARALNWPLKSELWLRDRLVAIIPPSKGKKSDWRTPP